MTAIGRVEGALFTIMGRAKVEGMLFITMGRGEGDGEARREGEGGEAELTISSISMFNNRGISNSFFTNERLPLSPILTL